ncbi:MAG: hypothetical protein JJU36_13140 [Phycisphaeraceae bacterium]|nr:hypothetical protein [Phycisphaeraceae bacterium]
MSQSSSSPGPQANRPIEGSKMLVISFLLAFFAVVVVLVYVSQIRAQNVEQMVTLYRLNKSLEPGDVFSADRDVTSFRVPNSIVPNLEYLSPIVGDADLQGRNRTEVRRAASANSLVTNFLFREMDEGLVSGLPSDDRRGFPITITGDEVPETLRPGMTVDIIGTFPPGAGGSFPRKMLVMENVRVLNVGSLVRDATGEGRGAARGFRTIGLDIGPEDQVPLAQVRTITSQYGGFQLTLRNPGDRRRTWTPSRTSNPPIHNVNPEVVRVVESLTGSRLYGR